MNKEIIRFDLFNESYEFTLRKYNKLYINNNWEIYLRLITKLKEYSNLKYDDYDLNNYQIGRIYLGKKELTKKNFLFLDFTDVHNIIFNISMSKQSLARKNFITKINREFDVLEFENINSTIEEIVASNIEFREKDYTIDKLLELIFVLQNENNEILNFNNIVNIIKNFLEYNREYTILILVNTNYNIIDYSLFCNIQNTIILDINEQYTGEYSKIIYILKNEFKEINTDKLKNRIEFNWPTKISIKQIEVYMKLYFQDVRNDNIDFILKINEEVIIFYIIVRNLLELKISKMILKYSSKNKKINDFIKDNMV